MNSFESPTATIVFADNASPLKVAGGELHGIYESRDTIVKGFLDLMTVKFLSSYKTRPLQMFGSVGFLMGAVGLLMCAWVTYQRFFGYQSANRPLFIVGVFMILAAVNLIMSGLQAELTARTYHESQDKPTYVIREIREARPERPREVVGA